MKLAVHEKYAIEGLSIIRAAMPGELLAQSSTGDSGESMFDIGRMLHSFVLGNWLTDMSQVVDPVTYAGIAKGLEEIKQKMREPSSTSSRYLARAFDALWAEDARDAALSFAKTMFENGSDCYIGDFLRDLVYVWGYFKFVRPTTGKRLLQYSYYKHVHSVHFTQYLPHRHFDRWPAPDKNSPEEVGSKGDDVRLRHDHVVQTIEYLTELYTKVDMTWAYPMYGGNWPADEEAGKTWCENLALLGSALHTTEDFFAHTNYVEELLHLCGMTPSNRKDAHIHDRRRRHYDGTNADDSTYPGKSKPLMESHIVGGIFEGIDTLWSIGSLIGEDVISNPRYVPDISADFHKVLKAIETVALPREDRSVTREEAEDIFKRALPEDLARLTGEGQRDIMDACLRLWEINQLFRALNPWNWTLLKALRNTITLLRRIVTLDFRLILLPEKVKAQLRWLARRWLGGMRIGSHTLLNKDSGEELHYRHAEHLAVGLHRYIMDVLLRWKRPNVDDYGTGCLYDLERPTWIDWRQLLDYFLCHPLRVSNAVPANHDTASAAPTLWYNPRTDGAITMEKKMVRGGSHGHLPVFVDYPTAVERGQLCKMKELTCDFNRTGS